MDDARIQALTQEVLSRLREPERPAVPSADLEARVQALEARVRELQAIVSSVPTATVTAATVTVQALPHPSLQVLDVDRGSTSCVLEPDKPCTASGQCRSYGY
jgi:hypothetical protein